MTRTRKWAAVVALGLTSFIGTLTLLAPSAMALQTPATPECAEASNLTDLGDPSGALEVVKQVRAAAPGGASTACADEYAAAVANRAKAATLMQWASRLGDAAAALPDEKATTPLPQPVPETCSALDVALSALPVNKAAATKAQTRAVTEALRCDSKNKVAIGAKKALGADADTLAQSSKTEWTKFKNRYLDPWVAVLLAFLVWAAVVLVVARLLLVLMRNLTARAMSRLDALRPILLTLAWLTLTVSSALGVGLFSLLEWRITTKQWLLATIAGVVLATVGAVLLAGFAGRPKGVTPTAPFSQRWPSYRVGNTVVGGLFLVAAAAALIVPRPLKAGGPLVTHPWIGVAVGLLAALFFAVAWGAGRRLTITSKGEKAPTSEYMRSLVMRLAPDAPKGAEVPGGTDADVLTAVGIVETSKTPLVAALARVLQLARPPTPWQLMVTGHSDAALTAELSRNGRVLESASIERATIEGVVGGGKTDGKGDGEAKPPEGSSGSDEAAKDVQLAVFAAALAVIRIATQDGGNPAGLAGATKWRSLAYQYLASLQPRGGQTARALSAQAVAIDPGNQLARVGYWHALYREADTAEDLRVYRALLEGVLGVDPSTGPLEAEPTLRMRLLYTRVAVGINLSALPGNTDPALVQRAGQLVDAVNDAAGGVDDDFRLSMQRNVSALVVSVRPDPPPPAWSVQPPESALRPEDNGPLINYSLGCYYANNWVSPIDTADLAVRHLRLASVRAELDSWRARDPQLAAFRKTSQYRKAFGDDPPKDVLGVEPFSKHADDLRSAGLVTLALIASASQRELETGLGLKPSVASWLRLLAAAGAGLPREKKLEPWRLALVSALAERGLTAVPPTARERRKLRREIAKTWRSYKESPTARELRRWIPDEA